MKNKIKRLAFLAATIVTCLCVSAQNEENAKQEKKIDWDKIPIFTTQSVLVTDDNGKPLLNEDGTQQRRVYLVDQFGNRRSKKSVDAQQKAIKKAIAKVVGKVGIGTLIGSGIGVGAALLEKKKTSEVVTTGVVGGVAGGAVGYSFSEEDRAIAKKHRASLKEQEKLLEQYKKTFTDEGIPVDAKVDLTNVKGIDFTKGEIVSMSANEVRKELESKSFNDTDTSAWDI